MACCAVIFGFDSANPTTVPCPLRCGPSTAAPPSVHSSVNSLLPSSALPAAASSCTLRLPPGTFPPPLWSGASSSSARRAGFLGMQTFSLLLLLLLLILLNGIIGMKLVEMLRRRTDWVEWKWGRQITTHLTLNANTIQFFYYATNGTCGM